MYQGDYTAASTVVFNFNTAAFSDGSPITLAGTPAVSVYKNSTTESTAGVTLTVDYDARTGMHHVTIDTSADGTFYAAGNDFDVHITTGTVGGTSVVGRKVGSFSLENRSKADVRKWNGTAVATPSNAGFPVVDAKYWTGKTIPTANVDGVPLVDVSRINNVATTSVTTVNANVGTTQPTNFTGTAGSALVKADAVDVGGTAQTAGDIYSKVSGLTFTVANKLDANVYTWNGTAVTAPNTAGTPVVDVVRINNVSTSGVTTVRANVGTTQPLNFTGTGGTAYAQVDVTDWNAVAVTGMPMPTYSQPVGFLATTFPSGTVASTTNITAGTITTVTTATNLTNAPTAGDFTAAMKTSLNAATPVATLAAGAISDSTFTVPAESTTPPTGTVGKIHWLAARLGLRRVWDDVAGLALSVFKSDGTTPQSVNNYTRKDDGTRDLAAALTGLTTSADYTALFDGTTGRSTDALLVNFANGVAEAAGYGGLFGGGSHTIWRLVSNGAVTAIGFYGDGVSAFITSIGGTPSTGFTVKIDGNVVTPTYNADTHVGEVVLAAAGSLARGPHLLEIVWTQAGGSCYLERTSGGGTNPTFRCYDAGGNAKFLAPSGYGPIAYLREATYVRTDGGWEPVSYFNWNAVTDSCNAAGANGRGGIGSQIRATFVVPPNQTGTLKIATYQGDYQLSRDDGRTWGQRVGGTTGSSLVGFMTLGTFAPGTHTVRVNNDSTHGESGAAANNNPVALMLANAAFVTDPMLARPLLMVYGDSEFLAWLTSAADAQTTFLQQYSGYAVSIRSIGGSTVYDPTAPHNHTGFGATDTANITSATTLPVRVIIAYGGNDDVSDAGKLTAFQTAFQTMLSTPASVLTGVPFEVLGIIPTGSQTLSVRQTKNTAIQAAIAATGLVNIAFRDVEGWGINVQAGEDTADGTHANRQGAAKQAGGILAWLGGDLASYAAGQAAWADTVRTLTAATNVTSTGGPITVSGGAVTVGTNNDKAGYSLANGSIVTATYGTAPAWYTAPDNTTLARLADTLELNAGHYRFTTAALANAPAGGGGGSWSTVIDGGYTAAQLLAFLATQAAGNQTTQSLGNGVWQYTLTGIDGVTVRIVGTLDQQKNRTITRLVPPT